MKIKVANILKWFILLAYLLLIMRFSSSERKAEVCEDFHVFIDGNHGFINNDIVDSLLISNNIALIDEKISELNFWEIEKALETHPAILNADIYNDYYGNIFININQRDPIARVITRNNSSFYIDTEGEVLPLVRHYTAHVPVISGNIPEDIKLSHDNENTESDYLYSIQDLYKLIRYLNNHDLWKHNIVQIYVNEYEELEVVPILGDYVINIGNSLDYEYKFKKLEIFYKNVFNKIDWNLYSVVDLRYSNQVILKER